MSGIWQPETGGVLSELSNAKTWYSGAAVSLKPQSAPYDLTIASNRRTRRKFSVYVQYIFRLCCCRKCMDAIERLVITAAAAVIVDVAIASNFA